MLEKEEKKFTWKSVRIAFWVMVGLFVVSFFLRVLPQWVQIFISIMWYIAVIFTFVISIVHLTKHKKKAFAIVALVFSSLGVLIILANILLGVLVVMLGGEVPTA